MKPQTKYALLAASLFLGLTGMCWWLYRHFFRDGLGPGGQWDAEGGATGQPPVQADLELSYAQKPIQLRHFDVSEFDSKDLPGSGVNMKIKFLKMLDAAREEAGIPFRVNSGYRTAARNAAVGGVSNSAHLSGWAADIAAGTLERKSGLCGLRGGLGLTGLGFTPALFIWIVIRVKVRMWLGMGRWLGFFGVEIFLLFRLIRLLCDGEIQISRVILKYRL